MINDLRKQACEILRKLLISGSLRSTSGGGEFILLLYLTKKKKKKNEALLRVPR